MQHNQFGKIIIAVTFIMLSLASANNFSVQTNQINSNFYIGLETSQFTLPTGKLNGMGMGVGYEYYINQKFSADISFGQVFGSKGSSSIFQSLCAAIHTGVSYSLFGYLGSSVELIQYSGNTVVRNMRSREFNIRLGIGMDQFWFNGTESVYPASGPVIYLVSDMAIVKSYWIRPFVRYSQLTSGTGVAMTGLTGGLSFDFNY